MPGTETMSVSKTEKGQIQSAPGCGAAKGSLAGLGGRPRIWDPSPAPGDSDKPHSAVLLPKMLHLAPGCIREQVFCSVFRSSSSPFEALTARPCSHSLALNDWPALPGAGMGFPAIPLWGGLSIPHLVQLPALCTGPGCLAHPAAGTGELETLLTQSQSSSLFPSTLPKGPAA